MHSFSDLFNIYFAVIVEVYDVYCMTYLILSHRCIDTALLSKIIWICCMAFLPSGTTRLINNFVMSSKSDCI